MQRASRQERPRPQDGHVRLDAEWLVDVAAHGMVLPRFVPPPAIRELRELTRYRKTQTDARVAEIQRLEGRLTGVPPDARARIDEVTRLIVEKLLLEPTEQLKALPDEETQAIYTEVVSRLFRLGGEPAEADAGEPEPFPTDRSQK